MDSKSSYLMKNINLTIPNYPIKTYNICMNNNDLFWIPNFLSEYEIKPFEEKINNIRAHLNLNKLEEQTVGSFTMNLDTYKYIAHQKGRYDIWNIASTIKVPSFLEKFTRKSIGVLLVDSNTFTNGIYHRDTIELFDSVPNCKLPPFYYNMLISLTDQTIDNAPTQFIMDDAIYWVPLKRGDAIVFNGELIHRGTANITTSHRDMIYAIFTTYWYDEEKL